MLTQNQIKFVRSLHLKKFRDEQRQFIAEGPKIINDIIEKGLPVVSLFAKNEWLDKNTETISKNNINYFEVNDKELERISCLSTPNQVLAVLDYFPGKTFSIKSFSGITLILDGISDPGNFGTIIRTADWFGITNIICSENCVELYNPKVIQATMGSFLRTTIYYTNLEKFLSINKGNAYVYGAYMIGEPLYNATKKENPIIIIGSESKGISPELEKYINIKIAIPLQNKAETTHAESLNASIATALICYEFTKQQ
ncbi:MAG TPA: RNA methyltransferase [Bacteroidales bacterium]|nr:RNA methyltransferase [Bacteroidales bacterium]HPS15601.1 RNA methyltransferase [Bacteroidales bacterium]